MPPRTTLLAGALLGTQAILAWPSSLLAAADNGFDLSTLSIPADEVHHGGPPRDGIPALDRPRFLAANRATLDDAERVLGLVVADEARAYPVNILNYHEIVNDRIGDVPVVITWCPLCGTGMVFAADPAGETLSFGVSGLLYNSDVLLYDRQTESLWSQLLAEAVSGHYRGQRLRELPVHYTTWGAWRQRHPDTRVLSAQTGYRRDYSRSPYGNYDRQRQLYFPVSSLDPRYHPKERVLGLRLDGSTRVWPFAELSRCQGVVHDKIAGKKLIIEYDSASRSGRILDARGQLLPAVSSFWFAWMAFYPDSELYTHSPRDNCVTDGR